jgi:hypothetical protein
MMSDEQFLRFLHPIVHEAIRKNEQVQKEFKVGTYQRWYYDQPSQKLTFYNDGKLIVETDFQAVGSFSSKSETWMWSWHNESIEEAAKREMFKVKEFCEQLGIRKGIEGYWPADEYDPWDMTALALHVLGYQGSYRCSEGGLDGMFVVYRNMRFV